MFWILSLVALVALPSLGAGGLWMRRRQRREGHVRQVWEDVARHCPPAPATASSPPVPLDPRDGLAGALSVEPDGLAVRPDPGTGARPFLLPWAQMRHIAAERSGSLSVWTAWGRLTIPSSCGRAVWRTLAATGLTAAQGSGAQGETEPSGSASSLQPRDG